MGPGCYTKELSVLCDAQVTVVIFSSTGKLNEFSNSRSGSCSILPSPDSRYSSTDWWLLGQNLWILVVFVTFRQLCDASLLCHGVSDEFPAGLWSFLMVSVVFDSCCGVFREILCSPVTYAIFLAICGLLRRDLVVTGNLPAGSGDFGRVDWRRLLLFGYGCLPVPYVG
jgi:hypothetical protein